MKQLKGDMERTIKLHDPSRVISVFTDTTNLLWSDPAPIKVEMSLLNKDRTVRTTSFALTMEGAEALATGLAEVLKKAKAVQSTVGDPDYVLSA